MGERLEGYGFNFKGVCTVNGSSQDLTTTTDQKLIVKYPDGTSEEKTASVVDQYNIEYYFTGAEMSKKTGKFQENWYIYIECTSSGVPLICTTPYKLTVKQVR